MRRLTNILIERDFSRFEAFVFERWSGRDVIRDLFMGGVEGSRSESVNYVDIGHQVMIDMKTIIDGLVSADHGQRAVQHGGRVAA